MTSGHQEAAASPPSPDLFIDTLMGYQRTAAIKAAVELGLFTAIAAGDGDAASIARRTGAAERGVAILADYLVLLGFLYREDGAYRLTPSSRIFLDGNSPAYFGRVVEFLGAPEMIDLFLRDPASYVRNGGSIGLANTAPDNPIWVKFAEAMVPLMVPAVEAVAARAAALPQPPRKVLDISAGHGAYGIAVACAVPQAEVWGLDWSAVLALAKRNADAAGVGARYHTIAGSAFDVHWGGGYDLILIPSFLHHFDPAACTALLHKARQNLAPGGRVMVAEFLRSDGAGGHPWAEAFSFVMLATTQAGRAYRAPELNAMARDAGFARATIEPVTPTPHSLVWLEP